MPPPLEALMHGLSEERGHDPVRLSGAQLNRCQSGLLLALCIDTARVIPLFCAVTVTVNCLFEG